MAPCTRRGVHHGSRPPRLHAPGRGGLPGTLAVARRPPALQLLLKDPAPLVRMKAAETLGRLVKFA